MLGRRTLTFFAETSSLFLNSFKKTKHSSFYIVGTLNQMQSPFPILFNKNVKSFSSDNSAAQNELSNQEKDEITQENKSIRKTSAGSGSHSTIYKLVLNRVSETCLLYLKAKPEDRNKVGQESRYYYVKEIIDRMSPEEQKSFREYLEDKDSFFESELLNLKKFELKGKKALMKKIKAIKRDTVQYTTGENPMIVYTYTRPKVTKKQVRMFLEEPGNGAVMKDLIINFLDKENKDFKWYLNEKEDEHEIGNVAKKVVKKEIGPVARAVLENSLEGIVKRFKNIDKQIRGL